MPLYLSAQSDAPASTAIAEDSSGLLDTFSPVNGLTQWHYEYDIGSLSPGTYNLLVEGVDRAGNRSEGVAVDIQIDEDSDLPAASVTFPGEGTVLRGDINLLGSAVDDDGIGSVRFSIDDGELLRADGALFWSAPLSLADLSDGEHRLSVQAVDINGVEGKPTEVVFIVDREPPLVTVESHANGELVSGRITVQGGVQDANGIDSLSYSLDGGQNYLEAKLKGKPREGAGEFSFDIDTRDLPDGLFTILVSAVNQKTALSQSSLHLYIDNTPPEIEILFPTQDDAVNGNFAIAGQVFDEVGLASLSLVRRGEDPVDIPLKVGNPFWTASVDFQDAKEAQFRLRVKDLAGNEVEEEFSRTLTWEEDRPRVELFSPVADEFLFSKRMRGWVLDDDGAQGIYYAVNNSEERRLDQGATFDISLEELPPGEHEVRLRGIDVDGLEGESETVPFLIAADPPLVEYLSLSGPDGSRPYQPGMQIQAEEMRTLEGRIRFDGEPGDVIYTLSNGESGKLSLRREESFFTFSLKLPNPLPPGFFSIDIEAADVFSESRFSRSGVWVEESEAGSGTPGLFALFSDNLEANGMIPLDGQLQLIMGGDSISSAELSTAGEILALEHDRQVITLSSQRPGTAEGVTIRVEGSSGRSYSAGPYSFATDTQEPVLSIDAPEKIFVKESLSLSGVLRDDGELREFEYAFDENDFRPIDSEADEGRFEITVPLESLPEGPIVLRLRALDGGGNSSEDRSLLIHDSSPPQIRQIIPPAGLSVNGSIPFVFAAEDGEAGGISGSLVLEDIDESLVFEQGLSAVSVDFSSIEEVPEDFGIDFTDQAGNSARFVPQLTLDIESDKPQVEVYSPAEGALITSDFSLAGIASDDDGVARLEYRIDEGEFIPLEGESNFNSTVRLSQLTDNEHSIEVRAFDLEGVVSDPRVVTFRVSLDKPRGKMLSPERGATSRGRLAISGTAADANGIGRVEISLDNGSSFHLAEGTEEWSYSIDTDLLVDGLYMVLTRVSDAYGVSNLFSNLMTIDNSPPVLDLTLPVDGGRIQDQLPIELRVSEGIGLNRIEYRLSSLAGGEETAAEVKGSLDPDEVIITEIDATALAPGRYALSISAFDDAGNQATVSRDILKTERYADSRPAISYPLPGSTLSGRFRLDGRIYGDYIPQTVSLVKNGEPFDQLTPDENGIFSREIVPEESIPGEKILQVRYELPDGTSRESGAVLIEYQPEGPWIQIESVRSGEYVSRRPWISGRAGYHLATEATDEELSKKELKAHELEQLFYSLDNGRSFTRFKAREEWKFRLETGTLRDGPLTIIVKARFVNGEEALNRVHVTLDDIPPRVTIVTPEEGMAFNNSVEVTGTAFDASGLADVSIKLRKGSKSSHELPQFVQGLYLDTHFLGATTWEVGMGLTFFDDNVRLQALFGQAPSGRFNGTVFGIKLLANVATFPYGYYFGPDWENFSSSIAVGSAFEYFSMSESPEQSGLVLGAIVAQLELLRFEIPERKNFNAFSLYVENQLWFISSDIQGGLEDRIAFGIRVNIF